MKKCDLKTGMLVELAKTPDECARGIIRFGIVYIGTVFGDVLIYSSGENHEDLQNWTEDLCACGEYNQDIIMVGTPTDDKIHHHHLMRPTYFATLVSTSTHRVLWVRKPKFKKGDYVLHPDYPDMPLMLSGETDTASDGGVMWRVDPKNHHSWGLASATHFDLWKLENAHPSDLVIATIDGALRIVTAKVALDFNKRAVTVVPYIGQQLGQNCGTPFI